MGQRAWRLWIQAILASTILGLLFAIPYRFDRNRIAAAKDVFSQQAREKSLDRIIDIRALPAREPNPIELKKYQWPSFVPPQAGDRQIVDGFGLPDAPRALRESIEFLNATDRVEVTWRDGESQLTLLQIGSAFRLTTVSSNEPHAPGNSVTVIDGTAFVEDRGVDFEQPLAHFTVPVDDFFLQVGRSWWFELRNVRSIAEFNTVAVHGGAVFTEVDEGRSDRPESLSRFVVTDDNRLTSFRVHEMNFELAIPAGATSLNVPGWARTFKNPPMTWDETLPRRRPDWIEPVVSVSKVPDPATPSDPLASHCGFVPFTPSELPTGMSPLPAGAAFRCQVNLTDVPRSLGLPSQGLLQFFTVNEFASGIVRYFPDPVAGRHEATLAAAVPISKFVDRVGLRFAAAETARWRDLLSQTPRSLRFRRGPDGMPLIYAIDDDPELIDALAKRGVTDYVVNSENMMGGHWDANGGTDKDQTRLFMIGDDVGYAYWYIPTTDIAVPRFDRVTGGWTD
jgi:hypothetical protein